MIGKAENIVITEGVWDVKLLQELLPSEIVKNAKFISSNGYSSAISKAKSIALRLQNPIILVLDADTYDKSETDEKKEQIEFVFRSLGVSEQIKIFLFQPFIEVIFFESENVKKKVKKLFDKMSSDFISKSHFQKEAAKRRLLSKLNEQDIQSLREETSLKNLIELCHEGTYT